MANEASKDRVAWVDYSKGICIIAVVGLYATMFLKDNGGSAGWMQSWVDFARPFRMPDFFLIAGLFLSRTIDARWLRYLDRKVLHFLYLFALWTTIYFVLTELHPGGADEARDAWRRYLGLYLEPFHMLWFIAMLPVFFVVTRLLRNVPWQVVLPAAALLQVIEVSGDYGQLARFCERYVFFYAGYRFAPLAFAFADWAGRNLRGSAASLVVWAVVNGALVLRDIADAPGVGLVLGFAGAGAVIVAGRLLSLSSATRWLAWLGQNSVVVFLSFFLFTVAALKLLDRVDLVADPGTRGLIATVAGVLGPVLLFRLVQNTPARFLFARPAWACVPAALLHPRAPAARAPQTTG